jgi:hypothetical protein
VDQSWVAGFLGLASGSGSWSPGHLGDSCRFFAGAQDI